MNSYSLWTKIDRFPPALVRLLATSPRDRTHLLTDEEILRRAPSGRLQLADIKRLSYASSWDDVPVRLMHEFCLACDVDFADPVRMKVLTRYLSRGPKWVHLRRHKNWSEFRTMLAQLLP